MGPVRELFARMTETRELELLLPSESGMLPVKLLRARRKTERLRSVPRLSGISPLSLLFPRSITWRDVEDRVLGIEPVRLLELRLR